MKKLSIIAVLLFAACLSLFAPASASAGNLLQSMPSATASASGLTSAITGTTGASVTSGPTLTVNQAGTWSLSGNITTALAGATFSAAQTATCWMYRTNNTPGSVTHGASTVALPTMTTLTATGPSIVIPSFPYTTTNTSDAISVYCSVSANPGAGALNVTGVSLLGVRYR